MSDATATTGHGAAPSAAKVGMLCFLLSEVAFFGTLLVSYLFYLGAIQLGEPNPAQALELTLALAGTACLLSSSVTVHLAEKAHREGKAAFAGWWGLTILLGVAFLGTTGREWVTLVSEHGLTPWRNVFGSCYYTLVGFHALHVSVGVLLMLIVLALRKRLAEHGTAVTLTGWYWHFVDGVWVMVLTVVYFGGR
jgi:cytochrome c oxidase subunit III